MYETNCKFKVKCELKWDSLKKSESDSIRFCDCCARNVYLAKGQEQFNKYAVEGKCVAIFIQEFDFMGEPEPPTQEWQLFFPAQEITGDKTEAVRDKLYPAQSLSGTEKLCNGQEFSIKFSSNEEANKVRKQLKKYYIESKIRLNTAS